MMMMRARYNGQFQKLPWSQLVMLICFAFAPDNLLCEADVSAEPQLDINIWQSTQKMPVLHYTQDY